MAGKDGSVGEHLLYKLADLVWILYNQLSQPMGCNPQGVT